MNLAEYDKSEIYFTTAIKTCEIVGWPEAVAEAADLYHKSPEDIRKIQSLVYYFRGSARLNRASLDEALMDLEHALELDPKLWPAKVEKSLCRLLLSRQPLSAGYIQRGKSMEAFHSEKKKGLKKAMESCAA
ncbi:MAG: hypothetical protein HQL52_12530 [Magnetococcales bacterium]|nr:hypothetical protein [Magnetococcales bacterium]